MSQVGSTGPGLLTRFVDCGVLNKKFELHLISKLFRIVEEGYDVYKGRKTEVLAAFGLDWRGRDWRGTTS